jgi:hypothetical protein
MNFDIYQIKVTLCDSEPPVWRRVLVRGDTTLDALHEVLQIVMGWHNSHLHAFHVGDAIYGEPEVYFPDDDLDTVEESDFRLDQIAKAGDSFTYLYDFGDSWEHEIKIEKVVSAEPGADYPFCLAGERACPPEGCGGMPGYESLLETLSDSDSAEYDEWLEWLGEDFDPEEFDLVSVNFQLSDVFSGDSFSAPEYSDEELAECDSEELLDLMVENEDLTPRNVIDECARRGDEMADLLSGILRDDDFWGGVPEVGGWWLLLHSVMILGLMPSERAGLLLVTYMRCMDQADDVELQNWLAGYWPALYRNKPASVMTTLRDLCEDKKSGRFIRINAIESVLDGARRQGGSALEEALDWLAGLVADEREDWYMRVSAGSCLLDFPRERFRSLLEGLTVRQSDWETLFLEGDVEDAFAAMQDRLDWEEFDNPWQFYDPESIEERRESWEEDFFGEEDDDFQDDLHDDWEEELAEDVPFKRETPKIGRNDPCPCGSGKKYKKCCLH